MAEGKNNGLALTALVLAGLAAAIAILMSAYTIGITGRHDQPQGVCVTYDDPNTTRTGVDQPIVQDGTVMCRTGYFVPITPGEADHGA